MKKTKNKASVLISLTSPTAVKENNSTFEMNVIKDRKVTHLKFQQINKNLYFPAFVLILMLNMLAFLIPSFTPHLKKP